MSISNSQMQYQISKAGKHITHDTHSWLKCRSICPSGCTKIIVLLPRNGQSRCTIRLQYQFTERFHASPRIRHRGTFIHGAIAIIEIKAQPQWFITIRIGPCRCDTFVNLLNTPTIRWFGIGNPSSIVASHAFTDVFPIGYV